MVLNTADARATGPKDLSVSPDTTAVDAKNTAEAHVPATPRVTDQTPQTKPDTESETTEPKSDEVAKDTVETTANTSAKPDGEKAPQKNEGEDTTKPETDSDDKIPEETPSKMEVKDEKTESPKEASPSAKRKIDKTSTTTAESEKEESPDKKLAVEADAAIDGDAEVAAGKEN